MEQSIEIANGHGNSAERIERRRSKRGPAGPSPSAHRIGEASGAAYMPFGRIAELRQHRHHRRKHFAAARGKRASRPDASYGASRLFETEQDEMNEWTEQAAHLDASRPVFRRATSRSRLGSANAGTRRTMRISAAFTIPLATGRAATRTAAARPSGHEHAEANCGVRFRTRPRVDIKPHGSTHLAARHAKSGTPALKRPSRRFCPVGSNIEKAGPSNSMHCRIADNTRASPSTVVQSIERHGPPFESNRIQCLIPPRPPRDRSQMRKQRGRLSQASSEPAIAVAQRRAARDPFAAALHDERRNTRAGIARNRETLCRSTTVVFRSCRLQCGMIRSPLE
ncbi:hypothetical protein [Burkholderia thailandensis]|nr:hypothetical protein [Burkholderia thailandensis]MCS3394354.1 hypothetical protein [Burkholderia thailandensis]MCS6428143.1 hypothetical protein [Burkholderia thailandensis]MCS6456058.1 hypothetical protein [Burkholderia thailandensis]MCS6467295.1 hypothetical protein [Burkholderia thailandensis]MCS6485738.1 hypothetical protein [Burkholderia thailandensis]